MYTENDLVRRKAVPPLMEQSTSCQLSDLVSRFEVSSPPSAAYVS